MVSRVHLHPYPFLLLAIHLLELIYKCNVWWSLVSRAFKHYTYKWTRETIRHYIYTLIQVNEKLTVRTDKDINEHERPSNIKLINEQERPSNITLINVHEYLMVSRVHLHPYPFLLLAIHLLELMYKCNVWWSLVFIYKCNVWWSLVFHQILHL
jgi:hypothetical protein